MERFFLQVFFGLFSALLCFVPCIPAHTHIGLTNIHAGALYSCSPAELTVLRSLLAHFPAAASDFSDWQTSDDCCNWGPGITCASDVPSTPTNRSCMASDQWLHRRPLTGLVLDTTTGGSPPPPTYPIPSSLCNLSSLITLRLTRLSFDDQAYQTGGLSGSIPQCIGTHLTNLIELDLSDNSLTGPLPHSFSHLQSLRSLDLSDNSLSGPIPHSFSHLQSLRSLDLSRNSLSGPLPHSFSHLRSLRSLDLFYNSLTGPLPLSFSHLQSLRSLDLSSNSLTGPLPHSFSHLLSLRSLHLSDNYLSGGFFPSFGLNLRSLTTLDLSLNSFSGPLPSFSSPFLQRLSLSQNLFSGSIGDGALAPDSPFKYLSYLDLSDNFLSGEMPAFDPSRFRSLASLYLQHNLLNGSVPSSICSLTNLTDLYLSSNSLSGSLLLSRQCKEPMFSHHLTVLEVSDNEIEGPFPDWIGSLTNLETLDLSYNRALSGSLPNSWQNLSRLDTLGLSGVNLVAPNGSTSAPRLPAWCFSLPALRSLSIGSLDLRARDLHCSSVLLFLNKSSTYSLQYLDLSNNQLNSDGLLCLSNHSSYSASQSASLILSGNPLALDLNLPEAIQLLPPSLSELDMSSCMLRGRLSGAFFDRIGASVQVLVLANNSLEGQVASHLGNLSSLQRLDLSFNSLEGQVQPAEVIGNFGRQLGWLDLSHNHLAGFTPVNKAAKLYYFSFTSTDFVIRLSNNHLAGELSSLLENIFDVNACPEFLDVSNNFLTGSIPPWLQCAGSLGARFEFLLLHNNRLEGSIPNELFQNNQFLQVLSLRNNQLTGQIPQSVAFLTQLWVLDLSHNRLTGSLETSSLFGRTASSSYYTQLQVLLLSYNGFTGSVPLSSLAEIAPALQVIDLSNNHLTGMLPVHSLQSFPAFRTISTSFSAISHAGEDTDMFLDGIVVTMKGNAQSYSYFRASSLIVRYTLRGDAVQSSWYFKGSLKGQIQIPSLDLSGNRLSGSISTGLGELSGLVALNLSRNQFSGLIPSDLGKLSRQLQSLDLSYNELIGPIPPSFYNLTALEVFNVSYNPGLSGPIPQNQPQFERAESYIGDPNLCGNPILHSCSAPEPEETPLPSADSGLPNKHNAFAEWIDEWVSVPGFCLGTVISLVGTLPVLAYLYP